MLFHFVLGLMGLGLATGFLHLDFSFVPVQHSHSSWWEIVSLLVSLGLSVVTAEVTFHYSKKFIRRDNLPISTK
jgi:hypothetical protein